MQISYCDDYSSDIPQSKANIKTVQLRNSAVKNNVLGGMESWSGSQGKFKNIFNVGPDNY